jgi:hypothetical protein
MKLTIDFVTSVVHLDWDKVHPPVFIQFPNSAKPYEGLACRALHVGQIYMQRLLEGSRNF